jgi:hypothetical protein
MSGAVSVSRFDWRRYSRRLNTSPSVFPSHTSTGSGLSLPRHACVSYRVYHQPSWYQESLPPMPAPQ